MECWKTECVKCGKKVHADKCPQVGCFDGEKYQNSLCKKCWLMTNNYDGERRYFYVVYRDEKVVRDLTFDESWFLFTESLQSENPCSVFRQHKEERVD